MKTVLLVDDDQNILSALKRDLKQYKFDVLAYSDPVDALLETKDLKIDIVISDYAMPHLDGVAFFKKFRPFHPETVRIMLSGNTKKHTLLESINTAEVYRFIPKPWEKEELLEVIEGALASLDDSLVSQDGSSFPQEYGQQDETISSSVVELETRLQAKSSLTSVEFNEDGSISVDL